MHQIMHTYPPLRVIVSHATTIISPPRGHGRGNGRGRGHEPGHQCIGASMHGWYMVDMAAWHGVESN